jgi:hypothetical protein
MLKEKITHLNEMIASKISIKTKPSPHHTSENVSDSRLATDHIVDLQDESEADMKMIDDESIIDSGERFREEEEGEASHGDLHVAGSGGENVSDDMEDGEELTFVPLDSIGESEIDTLAFEERVETGGREEMGRSFDQNRDTFFSRSSEDQEIIDFERWIRYMQF